MTAYVGFGDPPCDYSGDHHWPRDGGGVCTSCGYRLTCDLCGQFVRVDGIDAHYTAKHEPPATPTETEKNDG